MSRDGRNVEDDAPVFRGTTIEEDYQIFDRLPPAIRAAMREHKYHFSALEVKMLMTQYHMSESQILALIAQSS